MRLPAVKKHFEDRLAFDRIRDKIKVVRFLPSVYAINLGCSHQLDQKNVHWRWTAYHTSPITCRYLPRFTPEPTYTSCGQAYKGVNNLTKVAAQQCSGGSQISNIATESDPLPV